MPPKLCYVLPEYRPDDATHFAHIHDFLREIGRYFELFLIVEKGAVPPPSLGYRKAVLLFFSFAPLRFLELFFRFAAARWRGYKDFYVHYSFAAAFAASLVARLSGGRVFYWNCGEPWKYKRGFLRDQFERAVYLLVTFQVTGAVSLARQYAAHYRIPLSKIKVLPNWIDLARFVAMERQAARLQLKIPTDKKVVLFVHRLSPRKGSRMILPAAKEVLRSHPEALFVVVGSGPDEAFLKEGVAKDNALKQGIRMEGKVPNAKVSAYFSAADVFFMPSEEEGFPRVLLESMALGVPFVASDVGAVREIVLERLQPYIVPCDDYSGFSEKLIALLDQAGEKRQEHYGTLREWVKRYDITPVARQFVGLFEK